MKTINLKNISIRALAEFIGEHLSKHGIDVVLVGGACVSIYTKNKYLSYDLDFITYESNKKIKFALKEIGFEYEQKKYYVHQESKFYLLSYPFSNWIHCYIEMDDISPFVPDIDKNKRDFECYCWYCKEIYGKGIMFWIMS